MTYKPIVLTVTFQLEKGGDVARFQLTIPELPKKGQRIEINGAIYDVEHVGIIYYSKETVLIYLKEIR